MSFDFCFSSHTPTYARLCDQGNNRNAVDEHGRTPLHVAAENGFTRVVDRLLQEDEVRIGVYAQSLKLTRSWFFTYY